MKFSALNKDIWREFFKSTSRFLSIIAMVALGSLVFIGLTVTGPSMRETLDKKLTDYHMPDLTVVSTYGLDYEDVVAIQRAKGAREIIFSHQYDVLSSKDDKLIRLESLKENAPSYEVVEGRLPEIIGEIAIDATLYENSYRVGDQLHFLKGNKEEIEEDLLTDTFTVVGLVNSPEYMIVDVKGRSSLGKGELDGYGVVTAGNFKLDIYSIARLTYSDTYQLNHSDPTYTERMLSHKQAMESSLVSRPELRLAKIKKEANDEITDAEEKISDARKKLSDAEIELADARQKLDDGIVEYYDGKAEFHEEIQKAQRELDDGKRELKDARVKLDDGWADYRSGEITFNKEISDAEKKLADGQRELLDAKVELDDGQKKYDDGLSEYNREIGSAQAELEDAKKTLDDSEIKLSDGWKEYNDGLEAFRTEISKARADIASGERELEDAKKKIDDGYDRIAKERDKLTRGKREYEQGLSQLEAQRPQLEAGKAKLEEAQEQIDGAYAQLNAEASGLESQLADLQGQRATLAGQLDETRGQIQYLESQIAQIESNPELSEEEKAAALAPLQAGLAEAQGAIPIMEAGLAEIDEGILKIEGGLAFIQAKKSELDAGQRELDEEKRKFDVGYQEFLAAERKIEAAKQQIEDGTRQLDAAERELDDGRREYEQGLRDLEDGRKTLISEESSGQKELDDALIELKDGQKKYDEGLSEYQDGLAKFNKEKANALRELEDARIKLEDGKKKYNDGLNELEDGKKTLETERAKGKVELEDSLKKLQDGEVEYQKGQREWEDGLNTFATEKADGEKKLADAYQEILDGEEEYSDGLREFETEKGDADTKIADGETDIADAKKEIAKLVIPKYYVSDITDNYGIYTYISNSRRMDLLSMIFPVFFYLIAMLVTVTTITRMVDEERTQIGTLKSLGYPSSQVSKKYLVYSAVPSLLGSIFGLLLGHTVLSDLIFEAYSTGFVIGEQVLRPYPLLIILTLVVSNAVTILSAAIASNNTLKHNAATLLRPKAPKGGTRIFLERIKPLWTRLSFMQKVTARNIFRYKVRMAMTIIGVAGCTALLFMGFGIKDSISQIAPIQFGELMHYNLISIYDPEAEPEELNSYERLLDDDANLSSRQKVRYEMGKITNTDKPDLEIQVVTVPNDGDISELITLRPRNQSEIIDLNEARVVITEKLATVLDVKIGDPFVFEDDDKNIHTAIIGGIAENYVNHYVYLIEDVYQEAFAKPLVPNADLIRLRDSSDSKTEQTISQILTQDAVQSIVNTGRVSYQVTELMKSLDLVVLVLIAISSTLAIVVLYNLTNINVSERIRELSTIKVLGFYPMEVTEYVYRETMTLTIMGILVGYAVGKLIHWFIITIIVPDSVMMSPKTLWTNYILSAAITLALSFMVMILMHRKLKRVNMVEALKAIE